MDSENWKYVVGYEKLYAVSTYGRVISLKKSLVLKPHTRGQRRRGRGSDKYPCVSLSSGGISKEHHVHKLVLTAFRGPRKEGQECRHLDGNPQNNHLSNLAWGSFWENRADWYKHRPKIVLTPDLVRYIRSSTKSTRVLAAEIGCSKSTVAYARGSFCSNVMDVIRI
jgi:NUMOD4 motif/HNH endonuclease